MRYLKYLFAAAILVGVIMFGGVAWLIAVMVMPAEQNEQQQREVAIAHSEDSPEPSSASTEDATRDRVPPEDDEAAQLRTRVAELEDSLHQTRLTCAVERAQASAAARASCDTAVTLGYLTAIVQCKEWRDGGLEEVRESLQITEPPTPADEVEPPKPATEAESPQRPIPAAASKPYGPQP